MDASGSNKRKCVADDAGVERSLIVKLVSEVRKFKAIIHLVKTTMRETEKAHELDMILNERRAELELLKKMKTPGFNLEEETRKVEEELHKADVEKDTFKVKQIDWDKLGYGNTEEVGASFSDSD